MKLKTAVALFLTLVGAQTVTASTIVNPDATSTYSVFEVLDAGSFTDDSGGLLLQVTQTVSATPEPASFFLIGLGLVGVGLYHRKKCQ